MLDQAQTLRGLVQRNIPQRRFAFCGRAGVGKSTLMLQLGTLISARGDFVALMDENCIDVDVLNSTLYRGGQTVDAWGDPRIQTSQWCFYEVGLRNGASVQSPSPSLLEANLVVLVIHPDEPVDANLAALRGCTVGIVVNRVTNGRAAYLSYQKFVREADRYLGRNAIYLGHFECEKKRKQLSTRSGFLVKSDQRTKAPASISIELLAKRLCEIDLSTLSSG